MKRAVFGVMAVLIFVLINTSIVQKEAIIHEGVRVYLRLAPVDPRSLMQGDYMALRYAIEGDAPLNQKPLHRSGHIVVDCKHEAVCTWVDFYHGQPLKEDQRLFNARFLSHSIEIRPDTFMFQEGLAQHFQQAHYGVFAFSGDRDYVLVDLADADKIMIAPRENH